MAYKCNFDPVMGFVSTNYKHVWLNLSCSDSNTRKVYYLFLATESKILNQLNAIQLYKI